MNFQMFKLDLEKAEEPEIKLPTSIGSSKKAILSDQCKEIEEKNKMGRTRDLFKKIRDTKGTFHDKGQKWSGPNRSRRYKKRWHEYTEELYKKYLQDPDNHNGVITHLEPDILECEVK